MNNQPNLPVSLTVQSVSGLLEHINVLLHPEEAGSEKQKALLTLKTALETILPFLPYSNLSKPDELELESEIREEIVIAGANENG